MFVSLPSSVLEFYASVLGTSLTCLKLNSFQDNFDHARYNIDGRDHSGEFNTKAHIFYFDWFFRNHQRLYDAYQLLGNEDSKRLYLCLIAYRLAGHHSVRIPVGFQLNSPEYEHYKRLEKNTESTLPLSGFLGKLKHYDFEFNGQRYVADCLGFEYYLFRKQYFYSKDGITIAPSEGDFVIDGGACLGDTAAVFSNAVGPKGCVYAFDPIAEHVEILAHNAKNFPQDNVKIMPYGISDRNVEAEPLSLQQYSPGFRINNQVCPLRTIDSLLDSRQIECVDFLKLDVEGSEAEAITGARHTILKFKPKLAISLYHKPDDLFELIHMIKSNFPFYKMYIEHYTIHQEETVLYGIQ